MKKEERMTNCFDDGPHLGPVATSSGAEEAVKEFFQILGWRLSKDEDKDKGLAPSFDLLGVKVDLSQSSGSSS